jgi:hypothetical protein
MGLIEEAQAASKQRALERGPAPGSPYGSPAPAGNGGVQLASAGPSGFVSATTIKPLHRLVVSVEALEGCGKTNFALTATAARPGRLHNFDVGLEGVINKFPMDRIIVAPYKMPKIVGLDPQSASNIANVVWTQFTSDYDSIISDQGKAGNGQSARTSVWDTATENWDLLRIARFGKMSQVMPHHYAPVNAENREQLRKAYDTDKNLILIHKLGAEWENTTNAAGQEKGRKTGRYERKGFSDIGFAVQVECRLWKEMPTEIGKPPIFRMAIIKCRQNPNVEGQVLDGDNCRFGVLGMTVYPGSDPAEWGM